MVLARLGLRLGVFSMRRQTTGSELSQAGSAMADQRYDTESSRLVLHPTSIRPLTRVTGRNSSLQAVSLPVSPRLISLLHRMEKNCNALQKEAKGYLDAMRLMAASEARIAETVDVFYTDNSEAAMAAHSFKRAVDELDAKVARELDAPYRATVLEPVGKLCSHFPEIKSVLKPLVRPG